MTSEASKITSICVPVEMWNKFGILCRIQNKTRKEYITTLVEEEFDYIRDNDPAAWKLYCELCEIEGYNVDQQIEEMDSVKEEAEKLMYDEELNIEDEILND
ncbi:hypothetical protein [Methanosphaera sp.]|jgi:hypothetical protein|uniref:hypothetical protein n=1 Tax=Methanosphaera sp. TaxID=2666342 RepID=UPI003D901AA7